MESPPHFINVEKTNLLASLAILAATIALLLTPLTTVLWNHTPRASLPPVPLAPPRDPRCSHEPFALRSPSRAPNFKPQPAQHSSIALAAAFTYPAYAFSISPATKTDTPHRPPSSLPVQSRRRTHRRIHPHHRRQRLPRPNQPTLTGSHQTPTPKPQAPNPYNPHPPPRTSTSTPPNPEDLILNLRDYPAWHITDNGSPPHRRATSATTASSRSPSPSGPSRIAITYARTPDQTLGEYHLSGSPSSLSSSSFSADPASRHPKARPCTLSS